MLRSFCFIRLLTTEGVERINFGSRGRLRDVLCTNRAAIAKIRGRLMMLFSAWASKRLFQHTIFDIGASTHSSNQTYKLEHFPFSFFIHYRFYTNVKSLQSRNLPFSIMNNQGSKSAEGRRRRTVFRKLRKFCNEFDVCAVVVLTDNMNRQFIFKTHDDTPVFGNVSIVRAIRASWTNHWQILEHPRTRTNDDFQALGSLSDQAFGRKKIRTRLPVPRYRRVE